MKSAVRQIDAPYRAQAKVEEDENEKPTQSAAATHSTSCTKLNGTKFPHDHVQRLTRSRAAMVADANALTTKDTKVYEGNVPWIRDPETASAHSRWVLDKSHTDRRCDSDSAQSSRTPSLEPIAASVPARRHPPARFPPTLEARTQPHPTSPAIVPSNPDRSTPLRRSCPDQMDRSLVL